MAFRSGCIFNITEGYFGKKKSTQVPTSTQPGVGTPSTETCSNTRKYLVVRSVEMDEDRNRLNDGDCAYDGGGDGNV